VLVRRFCCLIALACLGCGSSGPNLKTGTVEGVVTLDGQPYSGADVILYSRSSGRAFNAALDASGKFRVEEPVVVGPYLAYLAPKSVEVADGAPPPVASIDKSVPSKYWNEATTDIEVNVTEGANSVTVPFVTR